ncbi:SpoIIE family protein phosphatase [Streptomyces sp. WMMC500]|uniref:SpoIIE family protein phosphatase n=1 Tax=Streptomyces sp. WMMC500 TaxID=3015154 RepID=UPI00248B3E9C|nr:SpoIIE family protein phosphatase [Streptomyces sp. WMMC500]WBB63504.1 SpoIIE family protein phosphatase [Streptomyces sp. WMMC500]
MHGHEGGAATQEVAARLDQVLEQDTRAVGAHVGGLYLQTGQTLQMTTVTGVPRRLARPWSRVALAAPVPVAEAARSRSPVWLPDQQELARRFPRTALSFPYAVAMYVVPLVADGICWGAVLLLWPGTGSARPSDADLARVRTAAERMAGLLKEAADQGHPVGPRHVLRAVEPPPGRYQEPGAALTERLAEGMVALDLRGQMTFVNTRAAELLGHDRSELLRREPWEVLPWLGDPAHENAYLAALFSRLPTGFSARRPDGTWLSFRLYPDATGVTVWIRPEDRSEDMSERERPADEAPPGVPTRAGTLFHLLNLASSLTEATSVQEVCESLIEQMMPVLGTQGLAVLIADEGRLRVPGSRGFPEGMDEYFDGLPLAAQTEGARTIETGVPGFHPTNAELVRAYPEYQHYRDMAAFAFLPLTVSSGTIGCWVLGYDSPREFPPDERAELTTLTGMIAQALDRARLYDENARVARGLQDGLLPSSLPRVVGLEVAARYQPATHALDVGGDFYDLIDFGAGQVGAVIGDVQGHSVQAAALMGQIRTSMHTQARVGAHPEEVLAHSNRLLMEMSDGMFCSCLYVHFDMPGNRALLASAGHPPPILRHADHSTETLDLPPGLLLGIEEDVPFEAVEVPLPPGATLALYTDGLVERPGEDVGASIDRLAETLARAGDEPLDALADRIVERAKETVAAESSDDIALLLVSCTNPHPRQGPGRPPPSLRPMDTTGSAATRR